MGLVSGHDFSHAKTGLVSGRDFSRAADHAKSTRALAPVRSLVLRTTTTGDLPRYLAGTGAMETERLTPAQQHEEAWFLGLRTNAGVDVKELRAEFGEELVGPALETAARLAIDELLVFDGTRAQLTPRGRLLSNEVFQEFLQSEVAETRR
jgi:oxygen-independent coproporphyrinogen-3 oxidase